jgi:hypothetical protein
VSGETEGNVSGWTVDTLHTHLIRQIEMLRDQISRQWDADRRATDLAYDAQAKAVAAAFASAEKAVTAALAAQQKAGDVQAETLKQRADVQNEWRSSLNDVLTRAMPRIEAEAIINRSTERIQELISAQQHMITRVELDSIRQRDSERISELSERLTRAESKAEGAHANKAGIYGALSAATALIVAIVVVLNFVTSG